MSLIDDLTAPYDDLARQVVELSERLDGVSRQQRAFRRLGLDAEELERMSPHGRLIRLALALRDAGDKESAGEDVEVLVGVDVVEFLKFIQALLTRLSG